MTETAVRTRDFFHEYADGFNSIYNTRNTLTNRVINRIFRKSMELRYRKTVAGCRPIEAKRVLDVGCGPGHYGITLARNGAAEVKGIDFAEGMIELAREQANAAGVSNRCTFGVQDFFSFAPEESFDYVIVMGVMDYIADPKPFVERVLSMTRGRAFFSFPTAGGLLGWQRKIRYRSRCPLYLYTKDQVDGLFKDVPDARADIEPIARDFFVQVSRRS
jgi:2-polyprenyl-3-methyl-5-hydroxy-6-metoxy-1,4-benzoquinol methylase